MKDRTMKVKCMIQLTIGAIGDVLLSIVDWLIGYLDPTALGKGCSTSANNMAIALWMFNSSIYLIHKKK